MSHRWLVAVDIGNSRMKLGLFNAIAPAGLPQPKKTLPLVGDRLEFEQIITWLGDRVQHSLLWRIASVNRPMATQLIDWLRENRPDDRITLLASGDLPLKVALDRPDMVGIDRLVDAVAVNRLRETGRPAVIVDVGSAITVDIVSAEGDFLGGAILPGIQMSARALHEFTDLLPLIDAAELTAPPSPLGKATIPAMESGLFWGSVGAIRELTHRLSETASHGAEPQVFLTGGAGERVAKLLAADARYVSDLTLAGIALATGKATICGAMQ